MTILIWFILGQAADVVTTWLGVARFGLVEANPFMAQLSIPQIALVKGLICGVLLAWYIHRAPHAAFPRWFVWVMIVGGWGPALNNVVQMLRTTL